MRANCSGKLRKFSFCEVAKGGRERKKKSEAVATLGGGDCEGRREREGEAYHLKTKVPMVRIGG